MEWDRMNYLLGKYFGLAMHVSTKHPYPSKPFFEKTVQPKVMSPEEMERAMKRMTRRLNGKIIKDGNKS